MKKRNIENEKASENRKGSMKRYAVVLGIAFGGGIGVMIGAILQGNIAMYLLLGVAIGIIIGSVISLQMNKEE